MDDYLRGLRDAQRLMKNHLAGIKAAHPRTTDPYVRGEKASLEIALEQIKQVMDSYRAGKA